MSIDEVIKSLAHMRSQFGNVDVRVVDETEDAFEGSADVVEIKTIDSAVAIVI